jgi:hypothetical protein
VIPEKLESRFVVKEVLIYPQIAKPKVGGPLRPLDDIEDSCI